MTTSQNIYTPLVTPPEDIAHPSLWFAFQRNAIILMESPEPAVPVCHSLVHHGIDPIRSHYLGLLGEQHCFAAEVDQSHPLPSGWISVGLRDVFGLIDEPLAVLSGRAFQLIDWERNQQFCSRCSTPMRTRSDERSRSCPACRLTSYPPVSPAVMVLINNGRELLLARKSEWAPGRYSAIAGFVEPGEMLEDTVARETREEVGVSVKNIQYFGSQPWPFPHSLMVAFTAEYAGGAVVPDGIEIEEATWFDVEDLPNLPASISISRRLITTIAAELALKYPRNP